MKRIYPVLVTVDKVAPIHTYRAVRKAFLDPSPLAPYIREGFVQRLCLFTVRDIEWLEAFVDQGQSMLMIIHALSNFSGGDTAMLSACAQHLLKNGLNEQSKWHRAEFTRLTERVADHVRSLGLSTADSAPADSLPD